MTELVNGIGSHVPMNLESEEIVLGIALNSLDGLRLTVDELSTDDFYHPKHKLVFEALCTCYELYSTADVVTVCDILTNRNVLERVGGMVAVIELLAGAPSISAQSINAHIRILQDKTILRRLLELSSKTMIEIQSTENAEKLLSDFESRIGGIQPGSTNSVVELRSVMASTLEEMENVPNCNPPVVTGLKELDNILNGIKPSTLTIVGARPSIGKTAFALGVALNTARSTPVALFSLEMSRTELGRRVISSEASIKSHQLSNTLATDISRFEKTISHLADLPLFVDDSPVTNVGRIKASARRIKTKHGLGLIVIDYLQLITPSRRAENRQVEVSEMSRQLKLLARELNTPVIALSQLSRALEQRMDKRPTLADLRDSGALEQDADNVIFLYRDPTSSAGIAEIIVAKHRNGPTGVARVGFVSEFAKFFNIERR